MSPESAFLLVSTEKADSEILKSCNGGSEQEFCTVLVTRFTRRALLISRNSDTHRTGYQPIIVYYSMTCLPDINFV